jgi:hypothetical protein
LQIVIGFRSRMTEKGEVGGVSGDATPTLNNFSCALSDGVRQVCASVESMYLPG